MKTDGCVLIRRILPCPAFVLFAPNRAPGDDYSFLARRCGLAEVIEGFEGIGVPNAMGEGGGFHG